MPPPPHPPPPLPLRLPLQEPLPLPLPLKVHYPLYTSLCTGELNAIRKQKCFICSPFYVRVSRWAMMGEIKT